MKSKPNSKRLKRKNNGTRSTPKDRTANKNGKGKKGKGEWSIYDGMPAEVEYYLRRG